MELEPDSETMNILMQSYASVGDINGAKGVIEKSEQLDFRVTTALANNILSAVIECPELDHWNEVLLCHEKYFESDRLLPDEQTCILSLQACAKYGRPDEALLWFENFAKNGLKINTEIRRAFRSAVGQEVFYVHPMIFNYDSQNLMTLMDDYMLYLQSSKPIDKPFPKVIDGQRVRDLLQRIKGHPTDPETLNSCVTACIDIGDLDGAAKHMKAAGFKHMYPAPLTTYFLLAAYASHGYYEEAEALFAKSLRKLGKTNTVLQGELTPFCHILLLMIYIDRNYIHTLS